LALLSDHVKEKNMSMATDEGKMAKPTARRTTLLTNREQQVAALLTRGLSNKDIARLLDLTEGTVKLHVHHILLKLGVPSRRAISHAQ
jgi:two-component system, NarL family, nitrate/nitrite response regulator NarL